MRIPTDIVQQIQLRANIVEVVGDFVSLKKKGKDYKACCPFHNENTPSFSVSSSRNIFKCFGCGKGGDAVTFVMEIEHISYPDALIYLAKKYQIEIPETAYAPPTDEEMAAQTEKEAIMIALNYAKDYFKDKLLNTNEGKAIGLSYFKERDFNDNIISLFELGYSLEAWDDLHKTAEKALYKAEILEKAGLLIKKDNQNNNQNNNQNDKNHYFDRFRDRVIFPIHNVGGRVIGFGGRTLRKDKNIAKYINSPESPVYNKSQVLYGLFQSKKSIREKDFCFLVEGYTDVISLHQAGVENVVASSGTSLTIEQIRLLRRFTTNITVLYDGDAAGIKAALRGIDLILEEGLNVKVVLFPDKQDPDSYVRAVGTTAFQDYIQENAQSFITFKAKIYLEGIDKDPFKRAEAIKEVVSSIIKIPEIIQRSVFYQETANIFGIDEQTLISEGNKIKAQERKNPNQNNQSNNQYNFGDETYTELTAIEFLEAKSDIIKANPIIPQEKEHIRLLLHYGSMEIGENNATFANYLLSEINEISFQTPIYQTILDIFKENLAKGHSPDTNFFIHHPDTEVRQATADLLAQKHEISDEWAKLGIRIPKQDEDLNTVSYTHLTRMKARLVENLITENNKKLRLTTDEGEIQEYLMISIKLKETAKMLAKELGNVYR